MNILIALDYTKNRDALLEKGIQFARAMKASLTLLHVFSFMGEHDKRTPEAIDLSSIPTDSVSKTDFEAWCQAARQSENQLQSLVEEIRTTGLAVQGQHILGQPGPVICARAEILKADVILIGRRSQHHPSERALGSVSSFVAHHAPCSVWIIQEED